MRSPPPSDPLACALRLRISSALPELFCRPTVLCLRLERDCARPAAVERNPWCEEATTKDRIVDLLKEKTVEGEEGIVVKNTTSKWTARRGPSAASAPPFPATTCAPTQLRHVYLSVAAVGC